MIESLDHAGQLRFTTLSNAQSYRVEWAATPAGPWQSSWSNLFTIPHGGTDVITVPVPMCYRVLAFTTNPPAPEPFIDAIVPSYGSTAGGTLVAVLGTNFVGITTANWGGSNVPVTLAPGNTKFTLTTPPHSLGSINLSVTNGAGRVASRTNAFTYVLPIPTNRPIVVDGLSGDWSSDCLLAEEVTPSNWGAPNTLGKLFASYNLQTLYLAVEGRVETGVNPNVCLIYLDRDFGAGTGVSNLAACTDSIGVLDNGLASLINASAVVGFGAEFGLGTSGMRSVNTNSVYPATDYAGMRDIASNPANFGWVVGPDSKSLVTVAANTNAPGFTEFAIPWTTLYGPSGFPGSGTTLALFARIGNYDGTFISNQCLPPGDEANPQTVRYATILHLP